MTTKKKETGAEKLQNQQTSGDPTPKNETAGEKPVKEPAPETETSGEKAVKEPAPEAEKTGEKLVQDQPTEQTTKAPEPTKETGKKGEVQKAIPQGMKPYFNSYPANKVFYRTSDGQVFLEKDNHLAQNHQRSLKKGELETIKR